MADENENENEDPPEGEPKPKAEGNTFEYEGKTYTQQQIQRLFRREKDEGKRAGRREMLETLGITEEELDEVKSKIKPTEEGKPKGGDDEALRQAQQREAQAARQRDEAQAEAKRLRHEARVERALVQADVPAKSVTRVAGMLGLEVGADDDAIADEIDSLKEEFPNLFQPVSKEEQEEEEKDKKDPRTGLPPASFPGRPPRTPTKGGNAEERATNILHERHPRLAKN